MLNSYDFLEQNCNGFVILPTQQRVDVCMKRIQSNRNTTQLQDTEIEASFRSVLEKKRYQYTHLAPVLSDAISRKVQVLHGCVRLSVGKASLWAWRVLATASVNRAVPRKGTAPTPVPAPASATKSHVNIKCSAHTFDFTQRKDR